MCFICHCHGVRSGRLCSLLLVPLVIQYYLFSRHAALHGGLVAQRPGPLPRAVGLASGRAPINPHLSTSSNGCQPARRLGWAARAYHKEDGEKTQSGPHRRCLLYDGVKPNGRFGVMLGTWNVGSLIVKGVEICEELTKRRVRMYSYSNRGPIT